MKKPNVLDWIVVIVTFVGGINWGLVGLFHFNLVSALFGDMSTLSRVIYVVVGLCAIYLLVKFLTSFSGCCNSEDKKK